MENLDDRNFNSPIKAAEVRFSTTIEVYGDTRDRIKRKAKSLGKSMKKLLDDTF